MPAATRKSDTSLRRHPLLAWWGARDAVASRISLADYLRYRAAQYLQRLAQGGLRLPLVVALKGTELELRELEPKRLPESPRSAEPTDDPGAWEGDLAREHGVESVVALAAARSAAKDLAERVAAARATAAARREELAEALAKGLVAAAGEGTSVEAARLDPPSLLGIILVGLATSVVMAGEAWQLALPFLDGAGLDANDLWNELQRAPSQVVAQFTIAVSATALLVLTGHGAFWLGRCALSLSDSPLSRRLAGAGAFALTLLVGVAGALLGSVRHASNAAGSDLASAFGSGNGTIPTAVFQLLAAGLPFLSACLAKWLAGLMKRRGTILGEARAAARALAARQSERAALEERIQLADREVDRLLLERAGQEGTVLRLGCLGEQASRAAAEEAWLEGEALARAREDLRAALEVDRFAFLKAAGRAGHTGLWSGDGVVTLLTPAPCAAPSAQEAA